MAASLDDIFSSQQNSVQAINGIATALKRNAGQVTSLTVEADTLILRGIGRLVNVCVVDGGSADGSIYDTVNEASPPAANLLYVVPQTEGVYVIGQEFINGLFIEVGTGQKINVTYSSP